MRLFDMSCFANMRLVDAHHHFLDPEQPHHAFLAELGAPAYTPEQYAAETSALPFVASVHIEAMADDGLAEAEWVGSLVAAGRCRVAAIVANADLAAADAEDKLSALAKCVSGLVRGIRYILDYDGPFDGGGNATHVYAKRPGRGIDYLRDPDEAPKFERGFAKLAAFALSFDLQCAVAQLPAAAALCSRHPATRVVLDHLGKPFKLKADGGSADAAQLAAWRAGMAELAKLPQVYVKLSMLGFAVPGWPADPAKEQLVQELVLEVVGLFGAARCMFASNWHINGPVSNADSGADSEITAGELYSKFDAWVSPLPEADRQLLFGGTATEFYRLSL